MSFLTTTNFVEKYGSNLKSSSTSMKFNYKIWCKLFDILSIRWYIKFYDVLFWCFTAVSICAMPITFFEWGDLEQIRHLLATWQDSRWRRIFAQSFLFQIFPHLFKKPTKDKWVPVDRTFTKPKGKFFMEIIFGIEILEKMLQIFNRDCKHVRL